MFPKNDQVAATAVFILKMAVYKMLQIFWLHTFARKKYHNQLSKIAPNLFTLEYNLKMSRSGKLFYLMRVSEMQVCADLCGQRLVVVVPDERHVVRKRVNVTAKV